MWLFPPYILYIYDGHCTNAKSMMLMFASISYSYFIYRCTPTRGRLCSSNSITWACGMSGHKCGSGRMADNNSTSASLAKRCLFVTKHPSLPMFCYVAEPLAGHLHNNTNYYYSIPQFNIEDLILLLFPYERLDPPPSLSLSPYII